MRAHLLLLTMLTVVMLTVVASAAEYHVAVGGVDAAGRGSSDQPFATIQYAADQMVAGDTCTVHAGTWRETVVPPRSGTSAARITFRAAPGETVTISGADPIDGWTQHSGSIWKAPMAASFFSRATPGSGANLYDAAVHNQADQVFVDGEMMPIARWPNAATRDPSFPTKASMERFISKSRSDNWTTGVMEDDDNALAASACVGAEIWVQPSEGGWSWTFSGQVTAKNGARITFRSRSGSGEDNRQEVYHPRSRYYVFNTLGLLDAAGEWYHDKSAGVLYAWMPDSQAPGTRVEAKRREFAFNLSGRSFITISGFRLHACTITTDDASGGDNIGYEADGSIRHPWRNAAYGRSTTPYHNPPYNDATSSDCILERLDVRYPTHFTDVSGFFSNQWGQSSGIVLSGARHVLRESRIRWSAGNGVTAVGREHRVLDNTTEDVNYMAVDGGFVHTGVTDRCSSDSEIARNTCRRAGRSGLMPRYLYASNPEEASNTWKARIHHNDVSHFGIQDGDVGGLYAAGNGRFARIDHNWFHDAWRNIDDRTGFGNYTAGGVYLDFSRNWIIDHNVIWGVEWGIHLQNQEGDQANFLVYNNSIAVEGLSDPEPDYGPFAIVKNATATHAGTVIRNNIAWRSDSAPKYSATDITDSQPTRIVQGNLFWDGVSGSGSDPRFAGGAWAAGAQLTSASANAIDRGGLLPYYSRDGLTIPGFNDPVSGGAPDFGAYEYGQSAWSAGATSAPQITTQPSSVTVTAPVTATFTVAASGSPTPSYQWQSALAGSSTFTAISGATAASYTTGATSTGTSGTQYRCVASNSAGSVTSTTATLTVNASGGTTGTGLTGTYFSDMTLQTAVLTRVDSQIGFDWGSGSPASGTVGVDGFSVRWSGTVQAQFSETYTFFTTSDDGVRLWVNGQQLIDNWTNHAPTENSGTINLTAGTSYTITMEYFENGGGAVAQLRWSSPSTTKALIPTSQLYPTVAVDTTDGILAR